MDSQQNVSQDFFSEVPLEILHAVLAFAGGPATAKLGATSKALHRVATSPDVWRLLTWSTYRITDRDATASLTPVDWAHEFQVIHKATSSIFQNCLDTDSKFVQLTNENRTITYIHNNGLTDQLTLLDDYSIIAVVQAKYPLYPFPIGKCNIGYYEITVEKTEFRGVAIGLAAFGLRSSMPGWYRGSFGNHGDDGRVYLESPLGRKGCAEWNMGDVIGCGISFDDGAIFFTLNGELFHYHKIQPQYIGHLYPTLGLYRKDDQITVNFGDRPFEFNLLAYQQSRKEKALSIRENTFVPFSRRVRGVYEGPFFKQDDFIDNPHDAPHYGFEPPADEPTHITGVIHSLRENLINLEDETFTTEEIEDWLLYTAKEFNVAIPDPPDLPRLRNMLNFATNMLLLDLCLRDLRDYNDIKTGKKEGAIPRMDRQFEVFLRAVLLLGNAEMPLDHPLMVTHLRRMTEEFEAETGQVLDIQDVDAQKLRVLHFMAVKVQRTLENQRKRQRVSSPFHADSDPSDTTSSASMLDILDIDECLQLLYDPNIEDDSDEIVETAWRLLIARGIDPQGDIPVTSDMGEIRTAILNTLCDKFDQFYQKLEQDPALIEAPFAEAKRRLELLENPAVDDKDPQLADTITQGCFSLSAAVRPGESMTQRQFATMRLKRLVALYHGPPEPPITPTSTNTKVILVGGVVVAALAIAGYILFRKTKS